MRRRHLLAAFAALAVTTASSGAFAQSQQDFTLINRTGFQINEVYVSPSANDRWGRDILGDEVMPSGTSRNVTFPNSTRACQFDIKVVYADGENGEVRQVNLCEVSNVTLTWSNGRTRFRQD